MVYFFVPVILKGGQESEKGIYNSDHSDFIAMTNGFSGYIARLICRDVSCSQVKVTHYCVKQNQPEMLVALSSSGNSHKLVYNYDMSTELCQSGQDHVHKITYGLHPMRLPKFEETGP